MTRKIAYTAVPTICALLTVTLARAQRGAGDWMTGAYDAQRSSWVRSDGKISPESIRKQKLGFGMLWTLQLDNTSRQLNSLTAPSLIDFYIGYRGFRSLAFFGGSSDRIFAVDVDLGRLEWSKSYTSSAYPTGTLPCPDGMTSTVTRPITTSYPNFFAARGAGRGTPAKSGVGLPDEGAVTLQKTAAPRAPKGGPRKQSADVPAAPNPYAAKIQWVLALTSDGKLHSFWVSNGEEPNPPVKFLPPHANAEGLIAYDDTAYVATTNGCGGVDNGVWALDLNSKKVTGWKSAAGGVAGTAGPAVRPNGTLIAASGGELTALAPHTLKPLASYKTGAAAFTSSPVVFDFNGKDLVAAASSDGRLHLLDADSLGQKSPPDTSAPFSSPDFAVGSLTSWKDPAGTRWILVPAGGAAATQAGFTAANGEVKNGALVAWKVVDKGGVPKFEPGWISRDLVSPLPPLVIDGVVFALSSGEFRSSDAQLSAAERVQRSTPAVLYALDPIDGKELWNSGSAIASFVHSGGLSAGGGRIYVSTYEGKQYAFGFPMEH